MKRDLPYGYAEHPMTAGTVRKGYRRWGIQQVRLATVPASTHVDSVTLYCLMIGVQQTGNAVLQSSMT